MEKTIRKKRPFYIVAHNPNSLEETKEFLEFVRAASPAKCQHYMLTHVNKIPLRHCQPSLLHPGKFFRTPT